MGVLKVHDAGMALRSMAANTIGTSDAEPPSGTYTWLNVNAFKSIEGNEYTYLYIQTTTVSTMFDNYGLYSFFKNIYADSEGIEDFDKTQYSCQGIGNVQWQSSSVPKFFQKNYMVTVNNPESDDIVIKSLKLTKRLYVSTSAASQSVANKECLVYSYYLDEPVTIPPGETKTIIMTFDFS